jgi:LPXTG-motif cell wall-anchored protein
VVVASVLPTTGGPVALLGLAGLASAAGGGLVLTSGRRRRRFG